MKNLVSLLMVLVIICGCMIVPLSSHAEQSTDGENVIAALSDEQRNSIGILNYLAYVTKEIENHKGNRLYLESAYSSLYNNTYMSSIDEVTLGQIKSLLTTLNNFQMIASKRERLEYIYEQNRAMAIRNALPNPLSILNIVQSGSWQKALVSVVYMAVESFASYESNKRAADNEYLKDGWDLDDEEKEILHTGHLDSLEYMWEIIHDYNLPSELAMNENDIDRFVEWKEFDNLTSRILSLETNKDYYQAFGEYWLLLAETYYSYGDMQKCLEAVNAYEKFSTRIFRKDYHYAKVLPLAIAAASVTYNKDDYIPIADRYASRILANCEQEDWVLRYFAAETNIELAGITGEKSYLEKAYEIILGNVNYLVSKQIKSNKSYLAGLKYEKEPDIPDQIAKEQEEKLKKQKEAIQKYNEGQKKIREVEVPPVSEALILNCDLLFSLIDQVNGDHEKVNAILYGNQNALFLNPFMDNLYRNEKKDFDQNAVEVGFDGKCITLPAYLLTEDYTVSVGGLDSKGQLFVIDDWKLQSVARIIPDDVYSFRAIFESQTASTYQYENGSMVWINLSPSDDERTMDMQFSYSVEIQKAFLSTQTNFKRIE